MREHRRPIAHWSDLTMFVMIGVTIITMGVIAKVQSNDYKRGQSHQLVLIQAQADRNTAEIIDRQVSECLSGNHTNFVLRTVLEQVAHPPAGKTVDYRKVAGWDQLPASIQLYLGNLLSAFGSTSSNTLIVNVLDNFNRSNPVVNCEMVRRQVAAKLQTSVSSH